VTRRVTQLEIEEAALKKETDDASKKRLDALRKELADLRNKADTMRAQWQQEKESLGKEAKLREQIEQTKLDIERAEREHNLEKAAELKYGTLPGLEKQLEQETRNPKPETRLLEEQVTEDQ